MKLPNCNSAKSRNWPSAGLVGVGGGTTIGCASGQTEDGEASAICRASSRMNAAQVCLKPQKLVPAEGIETPTKGL
jgi:hypothetical protein